MAFYKGLDDTAVEGADGSKDFLQIIDELESVGAEKESKLYLKTTYRNYNDVIIFIYHVTL